jgi:aspartate aminotransferase
MSMRRDLLNRLARGLPTSSTAAFAAEVRRLRATGADVINLAAGEVDFDTPEVISQAAVDAIRRGATRYAPVAGITELRQAIAERQGVTFGVPRSAAEIVVTNGAKQALANAFAVLLEPGDEVVVPAPYWTSFPHMITMAGGVPVVCPTGPNTGFKLTPELVESLLTTRTRALLVNNPVNPTGVVYTAAELAALAEVALRHDLTVICDEVYAGLVYEGADSVSMASLGSEIRQQTVTVSGFSKTHAMTGWRIGYAAAPIEVARAMSAWQGHTTSAASTISQHAALAALRDEPHELLAGRLAELDSRRRLLCAEIDATDGLVLAVRPQGTYFAFVGLDGIVPTARSCGSPGTAEETGQDAASFAHSLLQEAHVAMMPTSDFGAPHHLRVSYTVPKARITEGMGRVQAFLSR